MQKPQITHRLAGNEFHVSDCHIWAEIWYLDSPTDYREFLDENTSPASARELQGPVSELQMLDELPSPGAALARVVIPEIIPLSFRVITRSRWIRRSLAALRSFVSRAARISGRVLPAR